MIEKLAPALLLAPTYLMNSILLFHFYLSTEVSSTSLREAIVDYVVHFAAWSTDMQLCCEEGNGDAGVIAGHRGCVMDSDDFQWTQEVCEGLDQATSIGVGTPHAYNSSQTNFTSHSQPAPSHDPFGRSSGISQTSEDKFSSAVGIGSGTMSESRDSLRRFLFKPDEDPTVGLEEPCLTTERRNGFITDDGDNGVQIKRLTEEDYASVLVTSSDRKQDVHSRPGFVGVSPFEARMACLDVKRSFTSPQDSQGGNQGASDLLSHESAEEDSSCVDSKSSVGKENLRWNELFYSGRWNYLQDSQR